MTFFHLLVEPLVRPLQTFEVTDCNVEEVYSLIDLIVKVAKSALIRYQGRKFTAFEGFQSEAHHDKIANLKISGIRYRLQQLKIVTDGIMITERGPLPNVLHYVAFDEAPITKDERYLILSHLIHLKKNQELNRPYFRGSLSSETIQAIVDHSIHLLQEYHV